MFSAIDPRPDGHAVVAPLHLHTHEYPRIARRFFDACTRALSLESFENVKGHESFCTSLSTSPRDVAGRTALRKNIFV